MVEFIPLSHPAVYNFATGHAATLKDRCKLFVIDTLSVLMLCRARFYFYFLRLIGDSSPVEA